MSKRYLMAVLLLTALAGGHTLAQDMPKLKTRPRSQPEGNSPYANRLAGTVRVTLEKRLESKKLKVGDPVEAKFAAGHDGGRGDGGGQEFAFRRTRGRVDAPGPR